MDSGKSKVKSKLKGKDASSEALKIVEDGVKSPPAADALETTSRGKSTSHIPNQSSDSSQDLSTSKKKDKKSKHEEKEAGKDAQSTLKVAGEASAADDGGSQTKSKKSSKDLHEGSEKKEKRKSKKFTEAELVAANSSRTTTDKTSAANTPQKDSSSKSPTSSPRDASPRDGISSKSSRRPKSMLITSKDVLDLPSDEEVTSKRKKAASKRMTVNLSPTSSPLPATNEKSENEDQEKKIINGDDEKSLDTENDLRDASNTPLSPTKLARPSRENSRVSLMDEPRTSSPNKRKSVGNIGRGSQLLSSGHSDSLRLQASSESINNMDSPGSGREMSPKSLETSNSTGATTNDIKASPNVDVAPSHTGSSVPHLNNIPEPNSSSNMSSPSSQTDKSGSGLSPSSESVKKTGNPMGDLINFNRGRLISTPSGKLADVRSKFEKPGDQPVFPTSKPANPSSTQTTPREDGSSTNANQAQLKTQTSVSSDLGSSTEQTNASQTQPPVSKPLMQVSSHSRPRTESAGARSSAPKPIIRNISSSSVGKRSSVSGNVRNNSDAPVKVGVDKEEYKKLKEDASHYKKGYEHYKKKFKNLEASLNSSSSAPGSPEPSSFHVPIAHSTSNESLSWGGAEVDVLRDQVLELSEALSTSTERQKALASRNLELATNLEALSLKFKLSMENVGLRLDSLERQIKVLQTEKAELEETTKKQAASLTQLTELSNKSNLRLDQLELGSSLKLNLEAGSRSSLKMEDAAASKPPTVKRVTSSKELGKRTLSSRALTVDHGKPGPVLSSQVSGYLALATTGQNASGSISPHSSAAKKIDIDAFCFPYLTDLSVYKRKTVPPIMLAPADSQDRRTRLVIEMLDTEQNYVFGLDILMNNWLKPLLAYAKAEPKILTENDIQKIFADGALEAIASQNVRLCENLEARLNDWNSQSIIGDIFIDFHPYLKPYSRYGTKYEESLNKLIDLTASNSKFRKVLEIFDAHCSAYNGLRLRDYLITPIQRIPRYNLLLRDLLKETPVDHPDHARLTEAIEKISNTASAVNESIRQAESQTKMAAIVERGGGFEVLGRGNRYRTFLRSSNVDVLVDLLDRKKGTQTKRYMDLLMFNDLIVAGNFVSKKAPMQEFSVPTALSWIITDLTESPEDLNPLLDGCPRTQAFLIRGPESLWLVGIKKLSDFAAWMENFPKAIHCEPSELPNGPRKGKYDFTRIPGTYEGEWLDGEFHGAGVYVKNDGTIFDGHWDNRFKAGYGQVTSSGSQTMCGWKNLRPDEDIQIYKDHPLWDSRTELTDRDWSIILTGAKEVQFQKNEKVIEQGLPNTSLYRIKTGKCRVEKETPEGRVTLTTLGPLAYFGDTSVLTMMQTATADVICDTPTATIYVIEVRILFEIFKTDPALSMRFFRQLSKTLAARLRSLHQAPAPKSSSKNKLASKASSNTLPIKPEGGDDTLDNFDNSYVSKFDLPAGEVIIKEIDAALRGVIKKYGRLYLSQHFLCFEATVFAMSSKEVIPLERISKAEVIKKKYIQITTKSRKFEFSFENLEEFHGLLTSMCVKITTHSEDKGHHHHGLHSGSQSQEKSSEEVASSEDGKPAMSKRRTTNRTITVADETDTGSLTKGDWNLLQQGFKCITYVKDEAITEQGATHLRLFQIAKGKCRIQIKTTEFESTVVGFLGTGALLGEISFLDGSAATASVLANDDAVEVYVIEGYFINILFVRYPELAGRFYAYIASVIAGRLHEREASLRNEAKKNKKSRHSKAVTDAT